MIFFAGIESLLPLLIFAALALLGKWLKKKAQREETENYRNLPRGQQPQRPRQTSAAPPPPPRAKSWEEELRDLLEQRQAPPPIPDEIPPPIMHAPPPPVPVQVQREPLDNPQAARLHHWDESDRRYKSASTIQERVALRLEAASHMHSVAALANRQQTSAIARRAVGLVRDREGLRAAIIANVILGPPRALDESHI